jgi:hypothetical protein
MKRQFGAFFVGKKKARMVMRAMEIQCKILLQS